MPDFTIVTPVLNQVEYIEKCILSVLEQDCDVQYIIMDGGSTDGTADVLRKYENDISYWISEPDNGQSHAINKGLKLAEGTFFNWLNADDRLSPYALKTVLGTASEETQVVVGKCEHIDQNGSWVAIGEARVWDTLEATLGNYSMGQPSVFYRTETIQQLGRLNEQLHFCMDMDLWFRYLLKHGQNHIITTEKVLSNFLVHESGKSVSFSDEMKAQKYGIYNALLSSFDSPSVLKEFFSDYPVPKCVNYELPSNLNEKELLSNFASHLMVDAYRNRDSKKCEAFLSIVKKGSRLSRTDVWKWKARIASSKVLRR